MKLCAVTGCPKPAKTRGWCGAHYERWRRNGVPGPAGDGRKHPPRFCPIDDCGREAHARGWCDLHYQRWKSNGDPRKSQRPTYGTGRRVRFDGYVDIWAPNHPLASRTGYVAEHRKVMWDLGLLTDPALTVHHRNHNRQDNRPENLEVLELALHISKYHIGETVRNQFGEWPVLRGDDRVERTKALGRAAYGKRKARSGR